MLLGKNQLNTIDLSQNVLLEFVQLNENLIDTLDVSNNISLSTLFAQINNLSEVDLSQNINLTQISLAYNNLSFLDLSQNENLEYINLQGVSENNNINLTQVDVSTIKNLIYFYAISPNLLCIKLSQNQLNNIPSYDFWTKSESTVYTTGCTEISLAENGVTYIPDNNFEQALIDLGYDDIIDNYVLTSNIQNVTGQLSLHQRGVVDITGIDGYKSIEELFLVENKISILNIPHMENLRRIIASNNEIIEVDVSQNHN